MFFNDLDKTLKVNVRFFLFFCKNEMKTEGGAHHQIQLELFDSVLVVLAALIFD